MSLSCLIVFPVLLGLERDIIYQDIQDLPGPIEIEYYKFAS